MSWTVLRPIGTKVLVRLDERRERIGAVVIPECFARQPESGVVIAAGPRAPHELKPGAQIVCGKYNGTPVEPREGDPDGEYYMMEADHTRPRPHVPDVYGLIEDVAAADDVTLAVSSDAPKRKRA